MVVSDAVTAVEFLRTVFDAVGEVHAVRPAEMRIGDSLLLVSSAGEREVFPAFLYVYVDDADSVYQRALVAGAVSLETPATLPTATDGPWCGIRSATYSRSRIGRSTVCDPADPQPLTISR
jgi:uncharacterized glyoxalase superfamily protein PhnB